jgi:drug/metabolite transporter (DMT)-like permease
LSARHFAELLALGALWGASFLFMRVAVPEFGPLALVGLRVAVAAAVLLPLAAWRGQGSALRRHWKAIAAIGMVNSALPFFLYNIAALALPVGLMAIFNATAPMWALLVAWAWLGEAPTPARLAGLALGLAGVIGLSWGKADLAAGAHGVSAALGIAACLAATLLYGVGANLARRFPADAPPLAAAAGSQGAAALALAAPTLIAWPAVAPSTEAWSSALALGVACTGLAYLMYFRLIANTGATSAISVTLLIPAFAMAWGWLFLGEGPTPAMLGGCAAILAGTALSSGLVGAATAPRRER